MSFRHFYHCSLNRVILILELDIFPQIVYRINVVTVTGTFPGLT